MNTIEFKAKDVFGRTIQIMDTFNNIKIVSEGLRKIYKSIDAVDDKAKKEKRDPLLIEYSDVLVPATIDAVARLLGLTSKADKDKLENLSYSYIEDFFGKACVQFTGIDLPTVKKMQEQMRRAQAIANGTQALADDEELTDPK